MPIIKAVAILEPSPGASHKSKSHTGDFFFLCLEFRYLTKLGLTLSSCNDWVVRETAHSCGEGWISIQCCHCCRYTHEMQGCLPLLYYSATVVSFNTFSFRQCWIWKCFFFLFSWTDQNQSLKSCCFYSPQEQKSNKVYERIGLQMPPILDLSLK